MKRLILITLLLVLAVSLLGCASTQQPQETDGTVPPFTASMTMPVLYEETRAGS